MKISTPISAVSKMKRTLPALAMACMLPLLASTAASAASMQIVNNSDRDISEVRLSVAGTESFGRNQIRDDIESGQSFVLPPLAPGLYDVRIVADDETCTLGAANLVVPKTWVVTDNLLRACERSRD
jgi:hypothetical protein